jgi:hypothetical protein
MTDVVSDFAAAAAARLELAQILAEPPIGFYEFLTSPEYAAPYMGTITPSPILLGIALASEGRDPVTMTDEEVQATFRCSRADIVAAGEPKVVEVNAGRRAGKTSNLLATKMVHAAWTTPVPHLKKGERARAVVISPDLDLSEAAFNYAKGICESSPRLSRAIVKNNTEEIILRRPDGTLVEIVTGAANKGGKSARSRTLVFAGLDEAAFFFGDDGHTVNDSEIYDAAMGTLGAVAGAQCWIVSTSWIEGVGLMEKFLEENWGAPDSGILVAGRLTTYQLRGIADDGSFRTPGMTSDTYAREILSIPLPKGTFGFFDAVALARALTAPLPEGAPYETGAGADFAYERDCAALALVARHAGGIFAPTLIEERQPDRTDVTSASRTTRELADKAVTRGVTDIMADPHCRPFVREHFAAAGAHFVDAPNTNDGKFTTYAALKKVVEQERFRLAGLPPAVAVYVRDQMRAVVCKPMDGGGFKIISPRKKGTLAQAAARGEDTGSHGDVVSALVLGAWRAGSGRTEAEWLLPPAPRRAPAPTDAAHPAPRGPGSGANLGWLRRQSAGLALKR